MLLLSHNNTQGATVHKRLHVGVEHPELPGLIGGLQEAPGVGGDRARLDDSDGKACGLLGELGELGELGHCGEGLDI